MSRQQQTQHCTAKNKNLSTLAGTLDTSRNINSQVYFQTMTKLDDGPPGRLPSPSGVIHKEKTKRKGAGGTILNDMRFFREKKLVSNFSYRLQTTVNYVIYLVRICTSV